MGHRVRLYEGLYRRVYDWDKLLLAYHKASKGKRGNPAVAAFEYHLKDNLIRLPMESSMTLKISIGPIASDPLANGVEALAGSSFLFHKLKRCPISAAPSVTGCQRIWN